jgi:hypothetical protein
MVIFFKIKLMLLQSTENRLLGNERICEKVVIFNVARGAQIPWISFIANIIG